SPSTQKWLREGPDVVTGGGTPLIWVATISRLVVGYLVYKFLPELELESESTDDFAEVSDALPRWQLAPADEPALCRLQVLHLEVAPSWRRRGVGRTLLERFTPEVPVPGDYQMLAMVPETNLAAQLLLRSVGFRALRVLRDHFDSEDAYLMERRVG